MIVVLVILAILAAILVPALLGWIDKARNKQYVLQARNIVIAAQTIADEAYAAGEKDPKTYVEGKKGNIEKIADLKTGYLTTFITNLQNGVTTPESEHEKYTITQATVTFKLDDTDSTGKTLYLYNGAWSEDAPTADDFKAKS